MAFQTVASRTKLDPCRRESLECRVGREGCVKDKPGEVSWAFREGVTELTLQAMGCEGGSQGGNEQDIQVLEKHL